MRKCKECQELKQSSYSKGYEQGRADALDHCEKCEADQWDALYKSEMKGRADAIEDAIHHLDNSKTNCHEDYVDGIDFAIGVLNSIAEQLKEQK